MDCYISCPPLKNMLDGSKVFEDNCYLPREPMQPLGKNIGR